MKQKTICFLRCINFFTFGMLFTLGVGAIVGIKYFIDYIKTL